MPTDTLTFEEASAAPDSLTFEEASKNRGPESLSFEEARSSIPLDTSHLILQPVNQPSMFSSGSSETYTDNPNYAMLSEFANKHPELAKNVIGHIASTLNEKVIEPVGAAALTEFGNMIMRAGGHPELAVTRETSPIQPGKPIIAGTPLDITPEENEKGIGPATRRFVSGLTTPGNVLLGAALPESKAAQAIFLTGIAGSVPEQIQAVVESKTPAERRDAVTTLGLTIGMGELMRRGLMREAPLSTQALVDTVRQEAATPKAAEAILREEAPQPAGTPETKQPAIAQPSSVGDTAALSELRPALQTESGVIVGDKGDTHADILSKASPEQKADAIIAFNDDAKHVFTLGDKVLTRDEAANLIGQKEPLQSETLIELQQKGEQNAKAIRGDQGQLPAAGEITKAGEKTGGNDVEQISPKQPEPLGTRAAQEEVGPGLEGMGAAKAGEVQSGENADVYGVAQRVREQMAKEGVANLSPTGEGISALDSVEHGRELLKSGADPEKAISDFENTKRLSSDDMAVVRARGEQLRQEARRIEESHGTDSEEYRAAYDKFSNWMDRIKPMQTEWHKTGMAQQGEVDIDTGSFTGLRQAYRDVSGGKDFTASQAESAKDVASKVKAANTQEGIARSALSDYLKSKSSSAETSAIDAANKTVREAAARLGEAENKERVATAKHDQAVKDIQNRAAEKALSEANKTVREAAVRSAKRDADALVKKAAREKALAEKERALAQKKLDKANQLVREAAIKAAKDSTRRRIDPSIDVWEKAREYLDRGEDNFDEIRNKIATDLGKSVNEVTRLLLNEKRAKFLADEAWKKQEQARRLREQARRWVKQQNVPLLNRALNSIPRLMFGLKVGFHGTVALGTHAPMVAFQPRFWEAYARDFVKMYHMVGSPAYYESQIQELLRRPNYVLAKRSGLVNDPFTYEDYNSPDMVKYVGRLSGMGNRGYSILKILRQDMFDQMWNKLPKTSQIPQVAEAIADGLNHATGVVKGMAPKGSNLVLFAPRLEASRVMWLAGDPLKAANIFTHWNKATIGEKEFAINQVKEKAWVGGTLFSMLALNQGILTATGSKQQINITDPMKSDWLKFKAAGMDLSYGNAMVTMARLPARLYEIRESRGGKLRNIIYPDESSYTVLGEYARSQLSPAASMLATLWWRGDWMGRQLPDSNRPMPLRLRRKGEKPYTWGEFWSEQMLPIPAEEAAREVWKHGLGMSDQQLAQMRKAMATIAVMAATGARLTDDYEVKGNNVSPAPESMDWEAVGNQP